MESGKVSQMNTGQGLVKQTGVHQVNRVKRKFRKMEVNFELIEELREQVASL